MIVNVILLLLAAVAAFWLSAICGGGASLVLLPLLNILMPASQVPFALTLGTCTNAISRIAVFQQHIRWRIVRLFVPASLPAVWMGAYLLKFVQPLYLQMIVALLLLANLPMLFRKGTSIRSREHPASPALLVAVGFLAGFVSGITGAIGLLFNRFYFRYGLSKEEIIATRAANEVCLHIVKLVIYLSLGLFSGKALMTGAVIATGAAIAAATVRYILPYLPDALFRRIGYGAMVVSGLTLFAATGRAIFREDRMSYTAYTESGMLERELGWRDGRLSLEFAFDDGFKVEQKIGITELPPPIRSRYDAVLPHYDRIDLERVTGFHKPPKYEFYCMKDGRLTKMEY